MDWPPMARIGVPRDDAFGAREHFLRPLRGLGWWLALASPSSRLGATVFGPLKRAFSRLQTALVKMSHARRTGSFNPPGVICLQTGIRAGSGRAISGEDDALSGLD